MLSGVTALNFLKAASTTACPIISEFMCHEAVVTPISIYKCLYSNFITLLIRVGGEINIIIIIIIFRRCHPPTAQKKNFFSGGADHFKFLTDVSDRA